MLSGLIFLKNYCRKFVCSFENYPTYAAPLLCHHSQSNSLPLGGAHDYLLGFCSFSVLLDRSFSAGLLPVISGLK